MYPGSRYDILNLPSILPKPNLTTPFPPTGRVFLPRSDQI